MPEKGFGVQEADLRWYNQHIAFRGANSPEVLVANERILPVKRIWYPWEIRADTQGKRLSYLMHNYVTQGGQFWTHPLPMDGCRNLSVLLQVGSYYTGTETLDWALFIGTSMQVGSGAGSDHKLTILPASGAAKPSRLTIANTMGAAANQQQFSTADWAAAGTDDNPRQRGVQGPWWSLWFNASAGNHLITVQVEGD